MTDRCSVQSSSKVNDKENTRALGLRLAPVFLSQTAYRDKRDFKRAAAWVRGFSNLS